MSKLNIHANGQWDLKKSVKEEDELNKADLKNQLYHLHSDGQRISDSPMTQGQIEKEHGPIRNLESSGVRLVPHTPKIAKEENKGILLEETPTSSEKDKMTIKKQGEEDFVQAPETPQITGTN